MMPPWDQTGMSHFHSSITLASACLISARTGASMPARKSWPGFKRMGRACMVYFGTKWPKTHIRIAQTAIK